MFGWLRRAPPELPDALWAPVIARHRFLAALPTARQDRLRLLVRHFLAAKEFQGAGGFVVSDAVAVAIAAQAVLPLLDLAAPDAAAQALAWYDDFVGIVVHPGEVLARRTVTDEDGVVHHYDEVLAGEAMDQGPVTLSWHDVAEAALRDDDGYNVVIHEFAHKLDMRDGAPDGCPPLPAGFLGTASARAARAHWFSVLEPAYEAFREQTIIAERFGGEPTWLDPYAAQSIDEFFAVACEGYFVNRGRFGSEFPALLPLFDAFFQPHGPVA